MPSTNTPIITIPPANKAAGKPGGSLLAGVTGAAGGAISAPIGIPIEAKLTTLAKVVIVMFIFMFVRSLEVKESLIPMDDRVAEKNHQHRRHPQKRTKRQFVFGIFSPRQNESDAQDAADQRAGQQSQQGPLPTQECAGHQHHFHVAESHALFSA